MRRAPTKSNPHVDNPVSITVDCPACQSEVGEACTAPTDTGRRRVGWFHSARTTAAMYPEGRTSEPSGTL